MKKTNKSFAKRLRVTKKGKILRRKQGLCHFNAKRKRSKQLTAKHLQIFNISKKTLGKYLP